MILSILRMRYKKIRVIQNLIMNLLPLLTYLLITYLLTCLPLTSYHLSLTTYLQIT